ncbi:MAG: RibD family protein [Desulfobulbaceae bacterium]|nr:RibD family protein [Desulfobulbaceae bacterium]
MKVILIAAITLCGRISPAPLGSLLDRSFLEEMRDKTDASLMGNGTLRRENPEMRGTGHKGANRLRSFITLSGDIPVQGKKVFQEGPRPLIFSSISKQKELARNLQGRAEAIALPDVSGWLSIPAAVRELERRGAKSLLLEGGALLNYHALKQKVVSEIMVTITPQLSGDREAASLADGQGPLGDPFLKLKPLSINTAASGEIFAHYKVCY